MPPRKGKQSQQNSEGYSSNKESNANPVQQLVSMLIGALTYQVYEAARVNEEQKTIFATFMRNAEANYWRHVSRSREGQKIMSWERVNDMLFETYFPSGSRCQTGVQIPKFKQERNNEGTNKAGSSHGGKAQKRKWNENVTVGNQQGNLKKGTNACGSCGKKHIGVCLKGKRVCYNCGMEGHISPNCRGPKKGACFMCGSKEHLIRDCPNKAAAKSSKNKGGSSSGKLVITELTSPSGPIEQTFNATVQDAEQGMISNNALDDFALNDLSAIC